MITPMEQIPSQQESRLKRSLTLFLTFLKIGAFTFGGGYAMVPLIQREACEKRSWIKEEELLDIVAIAESTPGPIAVNSATFVGHKVAGIAGAFFSTIGVVLPSFVIISVIALFLQQFEDLKLIQYSFVGIRAGVLALILQASLSFLKQCPKNIFSYIILGVCFLVTAFTSLNVLWLIAGAALAGFIRQLILCRKGDQAS